MGDPSRHRQVGLPLRQQVQRREPSRPRQRELLFQWRLHADWFADGWRCVAVGLLAALEGIGSKAGACQAYKAVVPPASDNAFSMHTRCCSHVRTQASTGRLELHTIY